MKKIKKILLLIAMMMFVTKVYGVTITKDANNKVTNTGLIKITNVENEDAFKAYKVLDTYYDSNTNQLSYQFTSDFQSYLTSVNNQLTVSDYELLTGGDLTSGDVSQANQLDELMSGYASYIKNNSINGQNMAVANKEASLTTAAGSYLVLPTSTKRVYAVMVGNIEFTVSNNEWVLNNAVVKAKVSDPSLAKVFVKTNTNVASFNRADTIRYKITAKLPTYPANATNKEIKIEDLLQDGLEYTSVADVVIKDGQTVIYRGSNINASGTANRLDNYKVSLLGKNQDDYHVTKLATTNGSETFTEGSVTIENEKLTVVLDADKLTTDTITIEFDTKFTDDVVLGPTSNPSEAKLEYANDPYGSNLATLTAPTSAYTYGIKVYKHFNNNPLSKAEFELCKDSACNQVIDTITTTSTGYGMYESLEEGTYYLKEKKAPSGYKLDNTIRSVVIDTTKDYTELSVVNARQGLLPSTGGIGTYIYIGAGVLLIIGALIVVTKYNKKEK